MTRDSVKADEEEFLRVVQARVKDQAGKLKFVDVNKKEQEVEVKKLTTLSKVRNKYGTIQELRSTFSHTKSINIDYSLV